MSLSAYAEMIIGIYLSDVNAMKIFGAGFEEKIKEICPKCKTKNSGKKKFCGECGTNLKYEKKVSDGAESLSEIPELSLVRQTGLYVHVLSKYSERKTGIVIGKKIAGSGNICSGGVGVETVGADIEEAFKHVKEKLSSIGIKAKDVRLHLITSVDY